MQKKKTKITVIIILLALIALVSGVWAWYTYRTPSPIQTSEGTTLAAGESDYVSNSTLEIMLSEQPMAVNGVRYYSAGSETWLKHDALGAGVVNNSEVNIQTFTVAFCGFDESGNAIKIKQPGEEGDGGFVRTVTYDMTKVEDYGDYIEPMQSFDGIVFYVESEPKIATVKACVKTYSSTDGIVWNNPYYETFKKNYSNQPLSYGEKEQ